MSLVVIGANSGIAQAVARRFAEAGHALVLVARSDESLRSAEEALAPGTRVAARLVCDVARLEQVEQAALDIISGLDDDPYVLLAVGTVAEMELTKTDAAAALRMIDVNFRNVVALLTPVAEAMAGRGRGTIIILSSVAGDRGRQSNYVYGAAKAGLTVFAQGLRNRLAARGVHVLTVKPGYVDTPMLRESLGEKFKTTPRLLVGDADKVGRQIHKAAVARRDVLHTPAKWRWIMLAVRAIPEGFFKKMRL